jgi:hypothetical protein
MVIVVVTLAALLALVVVLFGLELRQQVRVWERRADDYASLLERFYEAKLEVPAEPPDEAEPLPEIPTELAEFIGGFEDPDDQEEYTLYAQRELAKGREAMAIAQEFEV